MLIPAVYILGSIVLFQLGVTWLNKGSSLLALKAGISPLLTGLTIIAFGTSAPGLFVSASAAVTGHISIIIGNVIGSIIFTICIVLGVSAVASPINLKLKLIKIEIIFLVAAVLSFIILFSDRQISRVEGVYLSLGIALYIGLINRFSRREIKTPGIEHIKNNISGDKTGWLKSAGLILAGIVLLIAGSQLLLRGSMAAAQFLKVGETIIGITVVAVACGIPTLIFSLVAFRKKDYDFALGNVIGSAIFNVLGVTAFASMITPLSAISISNIDLYITLGITLLLVPFLKSNYTLKRDEGIFMILLYLMYIYYLWPK